MSRSDYSHWNEEQDIVWWQEEGRHEPDQDPGREDEEELDALDAYAEECAEKDTGQLLRLLCDADYCARWPKAVRIIELELRERGEYVR